MKRLVLTMFLVLTTLSLSACTQQKLSFDEVDNVPEKVTEAINHDEQLQVINRSGKIYYIVFQSQKDVEASLESVDRIALVKLDEVDSKDNDVRQYIYSLTMDQYHDTIEIKVNGESMAHPMIIIK
ncbi:MAG TPA: peptidylprolyl isomerase [Sporosarcina psychrophila]|uniref:Peptidylprolyl isomerase n=1 Tax=Sporosarcina psychrophila TaxID=1476 RepID=A0A921KE55_SPOPS|nr:peptidylprolyl isomerase [Sporosarcina psychrophila]